MPAAPQPLAGTTPPLPRPPDPNHPNLAPTPPESVSHQPSPAVISSSSHIGLHILERRFIGPMPEKVVNSDQTEEKRRILRELRRKAVSRVLGDDELRSVGEESGVGVRRAIRRIRIRRRRADGEEVEEDFDLRDSDDEEDGRGLKRFGKKKKEKRKDVWVGESFDIGREFRITPGTIPEEDLTESVNPARPATSRHTTQDTFVTARTQLSATTSRSSHVPPEVASSSSSVDQPFLAKQNSQGSSMQPLISTMNGEDEEDEDDKPLSMKTASGLRKRLKSAIRRPPTTSTIISPPRRMSTVDSPRPARDPKGAKSVQFPVDPVTKRHSEGAGAGVGAEPPRKGNKAPASPGDVLSREGDEVAGTSAGAVEEALGDEEEEDDFTPGSVILRDRMLVRVGHHEEDNTGPFDEAAQRRSPCRRMEPMEEYIVVWRRQRVEFYQDWPRALQEKIKGYKRLCFMIPLQPSRTSLAVFNQTDMTLCLTTSAGRLMDDVEHLLKTHTTRNNTTIPKDRVAQSRQAKWLRHGRRGTHVFIMKIAERSRALDWYWELWRELGGELPTRLDIAIPALSTSVRLLIPEDPDQVGGQFAQKQLAAGTVVDTCWEMLEDVTDRETLERQRNMGMTIALAWKSVAGRLDWIAYDTTVQGKSRGWAVLAGVARQNTQQYQELQLRRTHHQPTSIHLEDGSRLEEPPAIEGFLMRHNTSSAKDEVYLATHDGNIFVSSMKHANPPLQPTAEGSTPSDLFRDLHKVHMDTEHQRLANLMERSAGYVDLRDITTIELAERDAPQSDERQTDSAPATLDMKYRLFTVQVDTGETFRFEAQSRKDALEWVERLKTLVAYWRRKQRVDARLRMDAMALHNEADPFAGTSLGAGSDEVLADIWDWCTLRGCRSITYAGRVYVKTSRFAKYRLRYVVLTGGMLITFKIKKKQAFHERKKRFSLFGSYVYSGMMAHDELHEQIDRDALVSHPRVYQDGLQSADGAEDTTFVVRLAVASSRSAQGKNMWNEKVDVPLSKKPQAMLFVRARSASDKCKKFADQQLERDRWVWAINAEMERMVRSHLDVEEARRYSGKVPDT